jgi:hypothetical protein
VVSRFSEGVGVLLSKHLVEGASFKRSSAFSRRAPRRIQIKILCPSCATHSAFSETYNCTLVYTLCLIRRAVGAACVASHCSFLVREKHIHIKHKLIHLRRVIEPRSFTGSAFTLTRVFRFWVSRLIDICKLDQYQRGM